ncbi:hypothetical protein QCA50_010714 [Cerrena zonata]|uniref:Reverse transcriptase zinc-binding domain-containing protein n=1 Tax=Cerrena zonata TaxID=2478898 RepID=A0AAW0G317_9APHY
MTECSINSVPPEYRLGVTFKEAFNAPSLQILPGILDFVRYQDLRPPYPPRLRFGFLLEPKDLVNLSASELNHPCPKEHHDDWIVWNHRARKTILAHIASQIGRGLELDYRCIACEGKIHWCLTICTNYNRFETRAMRYIAVFLRRWLAGKGVSVDPAMWYMDCDEIYCFWRNRL